MIGELRTEIEARILEIEKRLDAATPGPWTLSASKQFVSKRGKLIAETYPGEAELIASCPSDLRYLLSIVKAAMGLVEAVDAVLHRYEDAKEKNPNASHLMAGCTHGNYTILDRALTAFEKAVRGSEMKKKVRRPKDTFEALGFKVTSDMNKALADAIVRGTGLLQVTPDGVMKYLTHEQLHKALEQQKGRK